MEGIIDKIIRVSLYLLVFLMPIFFLPFTDSPVYSNKQLLLTSICFLVSILWLVKIIKTGKINLVLDKVSFAVLFFLVVLAISTFFSIARNQSFWGTDFEADTLFNFILYGLTFFLFANLIPKKEVFKIIKVFILSSGILALLFLIQRITGLMFPVGSVQALSLFLGGAFVILIFIFINIKSVSRTEKIFGWITGFLLFISTLLIGFWLVWLGMAFTTVMMFWLKLKYFGPKSKIGLRDYLLSLIILVITLIFIFTKLPLGNILKVAPEVSLTYGLSIDIGKRTLGEGFKNLIIGSGPATFIYKYRLYRPQGINLTEFWQMGFAQGRSVLTTLLTTSGLLGILAGLFLMGVFFYQGFFKYSGKLDTIIPFISGFYFLVLWIFYSFNPLLMFSGFLMIGLHSASTAKARNFSLLNPPQKVFFTMLGAIILMVVLVAGFYIYVQKYDAALNFAEGLSVLSREEPDLDKAIADIDKAGNLAKNNDKYFRNLSQLFLLKINQVLNNQNLSQEEKQEELEINISHCQKAIQRAIGVDSKNILNRIQSGNIYENLILLINSAERLAIDGYRNAEKLDPQNPQIPFNLGRTYKTISQKIQRDMISYILAKDEEKIAELRNLYIQDLTLATENLQRAISLKYNFVPAYYLLGEVYELRGDKDVAIKVYQSALIFDPQSEELREKIEDLSQ